MKSSRSLAVASLEGETSSTTPRWMVVMTRTSSASARTVTLSPSPVGRTWKPLSVIEDLPYIFRHAGDGRATAGCTPLSLERRTLRLNQEDFSSGRIHFRKEVIRDAEAVLA